MIKYRELENIMKKISFLLISLSAFIFGCSTTYDRNVASLTPTQEWKIVIGTMKTLKDASAAWKNKKEESVSEGSVSKDRICYKYQVSQQFLNEFTKKHNDKIQNPVGNYIAIKNQIESSLPDRDSMDAFCEGADVGVKSVAHKAFDYSSKFFSK